MISKDKMSVTVGVAFVWFTTQFGAVLHQATSFVSISYSSESGIRNLHYDSISGCIFPVVCTEICKEA